MHNPMLLNSESLIRLSKDATYPGFAGKLTVRTADDRWEPRFGVLKGNLLFLYRRTTDEKRPLTMLIIEDCMVDLCEEAEDELHPFVFQLVFKTIARSYRFSTENETGLQEWVAALATASWDHAHLTVESKRDELNNCNVKCDAEKSVKKNTSKDSNMPSGSKTKDEKNCNGEGSVHLSH